MRTIRNRTGRAGRTMQRPPSATAKARAVRILKTLDRTMPSAKVSYPPAVRSNSSSPLFCPRNVRTSGSTR
jgi:hypothetical protein